MLIAQSGFIFCAKNLDPDPEAEFMNVQFLWGSWA